jgi:hypothetical protein
MKSKRKLYYSEDSKVAYSCYYGTTIIIQHSGNDSEDRPWKVSFVSENGKKFVMIAEYSGKRTAEHYAHGMASFTGSIVKLKKKKVVVSFY